MTEGCVICTDKTWFVFVVTDQVQENVHADVIAVGQGVAVGVTVAAGAAAVDVVTAEADQQHQTSRRRVVLAVAIGLEVRVSPREVDHALTAKPSAAVQAVARNRMIRTRGVDRTVIADQRRVDQGALRSQRKVDREVTMTARTVILQARKKLPEVVLSVMRRHAKVDHEVLRVLKEAVLVATPSQKRMIETVVRLVLAEKAINMKVVRLVEIENQTEEKTLMLNLLHAREVVAKVVQLVAKHIASLQLVTWMIRKSILLNRRRATKRHKGAADHQAMTKTRIGAVHVIRKIQHMSTKVIVGRPVRKRSRVVVVLSQGARGKLEVEAIQAVTARIGAVVVQVIAARPEALLQAQIETRTEVEAIQPSVPLVLQRTRVEVVLAATEKTAVHVVARMAVRCKAQKGRKLEAVHEKIRRAVRKLVEVTRAVLHVHAAGQHLLANHAERLLAKATRNPSANLRTKIEQFLL